MSVCEMCLVWEATDGDMCEACAYAWHVRKGAYEQAREESK